MPEEMLDEFDREVDLMNKLRHKNIGRCSFWIHIALHVIHRAREY
jgi:hypothetical protein